MRIRNARRPGCITKGDFCCCCAFSSRVAGSARGSRAGGSGKSAVRRAWPRRRQPRAGGPPALRRLRVRRGSAPSVRPSIPPSVSFWSCKRPDFVFVRFKPALVRRCPPPWGAGGNTGGRGGGRCHRLGCDHHRVNPGADGFFFWCARSSGWIEDLLHEISLPVFSGVSLWTGRW